MKLYGLPPQPAVLPPPAASPVLTEEIKAQPIRLLDIGLFGPLTILGALNKTPPVWMRLGLLAYGIGTIVYNWNNFVEISKRKT